MAWHGRTATAAATERRKPRPRAASFSSGAREILSPLWGGAGAVQTQPMPIHPSVHPQRLCCVPSSRSARVPAQLLPLSPRRPSRSRVGQGSSHHPPTPTASSSYLSPIISIYLSDLISYLLPPLLLLLLAFFFFALLPVFCLPPAHVRAAARAPPALQADSSAKKLRLDAPPTCPHRPSIGPADRSGHSVLFRDRLGSLLTRGREGNRAANGDCFILPWLFRPAGRELGGWYSFVPCMDGKELISQSDLQSFYHQQQQQQQQHRAFGGGGHHSPSSLAGMHSVIRPMPNMPNMNMSPTAILNSIGGGSLAGMQFQMDPPPPPLLHTAPAAANMGGSTVPPPPPAEPVKRKRGRPRKYGPDGTMKQQQQQAAASQQQQQQQHLVAAQPRMGSLSSGPDMLGGSGMEDPAQKKRRGRPPGTGKKHQPSPSQGNAFAGSAGTSFTPHIITASPSEDVASKILAFASQSSRAVCVLSAMGSISRAVLRHPADGSPLAKVHTSPQPYKNPAIYEGFYEILSLTGSYNLAEGSQAQGQQSGGLSITLCSPERNVIGGVLGGPLVAASTVQVVLGSFHQGGSRSKSKKAGKQQQAAATPAAFSSDSLTGGQEASPSSGHNQNLTPPPSVTGGWPTSGIFDTRSSSIDINTSRG